MVGSTVPHRPMKNKRLATCPSVLTLTGENGEFALVNFVEAQAPMPGLVTVFLR